LAAQHRHESLGETFGDVGEVPDLGFDGAPLNGISGVIGIGIWTTRPS